MDSLENRLKTMKVTKVEAAKQLGISRESFHWKVRGVKPFLLREALKLHSLYFSKEKFEIVFAEYEKNRVR